MTKYFLDTEFIEDGQTIDLISIGIVCEDGRKYYAINEDCNFSKASDWVKENVIRGLPPRPDASPCQHSGSSYWRSKECIQREVAEFIGCQGSCQLHSRPGLLTDALLWLFQMDDALHLPFPLHALTTKKEMSWELAPGAGKPEFWADYCSYDWVAFCQLFGTMMDLPKGLPMYCNDLRQLSADRRVDIDALHPCPGTHNALEDAQWVKEAYDRLVGNA